MSVVKNYIGIFDLDSNKIVKSFKIRVSGNGGSATVEIKFKSKSGDSKRLVKSYVTKPGRSSVIGCIQAVCKYWPKFDPSKHRPAVLSQEERKLVDKKKSGKGASK